MSDFSEIHVIDLRYFRTSLAEYIAEHDIDSILVCYSLTDFMEDTSLFLLDR